MTAHEMVAKARNLPQIPEAALKLVELLDEPENNNQEVVGLIKSDAIITAKLLRVCNSSSLALAEPVASVDQAVLLLGYSQVLSLVISLAFGNTMTPALPAYAIEGNGLWRHAFTAASAAETLAKGGLNQDIDTSVAFTAGLLHDIGKLVMAQALSSGAHTVIHRHMAGEGLGRIEAEREVLGTDHAEVGSCLLHVWRLPDWIVEAVANHHRPVLEPTPQLSAVTHLANRIAHLADGGADAEPYAFNEQERVVNAFELDLTGLEGLVDQVRQSAERGKEILAVV